MAKQRQLKNEEVGRITDKSKKTPSKRKIMWSRRGPYLLIGIISLLIYVGIEITEGLGWLTAQDWLNDFISLLGVFAVVIVVAISLAVVVLVLLRLFKKPKSSMDWDSYGEDEKQD